MSFFFFLSLIFICLLTYSFEIRKSLNISCLRKSNGKKYSYKINGKDCLIKNLIWDFIKFWMTKLEFYFVKFSVSLSGLPSQEQGTRIYFLFFIFYFCLRKGQFLSFIPFKHNVFLSRG
jgi:hypothetical protein